MLQASLDLSQMYRDVEDAVPYNGGAIAVGTQFIVSA